MDGQSQIARGEKEQDSPNEVVDVRSALRLDVARPPLHLRADQMGTRADEAERDREGHQDQKVDLLAGRLDVSLVGAVDLVEERLHPGRCYAEDERRRDLWGDSPL